MSTFAMTRGASREHWRAFDAEAQLLARALRAGRLTVLAGALGVGKTTLLSAGVLPLLRRRVGDERQQPGGAPRVVVPFPDRRSRVQDRDQGERLYFVDQWNEAPLDSLVRALDEPPAAGRARLDLAEAMSPAHLSALSQRHGGARLLFIFDHFELLLKGEQQNPDLQRFVEAWAAAVQVRDLVDTHFLVAIDEYALPRLQTLGTSIPQAELHAFRLQARSGHRVLESLTDDQQRDGSAGDEISDADFTGSIDASVFEAVKSVREEESQRKDFAASLGTFVESLGARLVRDAAAAAAEEASREEAAAGAQRQANAAQPAETARARETVARAAEVRRAAGGRGNPPQSAADRAAAERVAEVERVARAKRAAEAAQAKQRAEAARQVEAARLAEAQRLAQALAAAEAAAAREVQARQAAEAAAKSAEAEQRAESRAQRRGC